MIITTTTMELSGNSYEIGTALGKMTAAFPPQVEMHTSGYKGFDDMELKEAQELFDRWCPGLNEELRGFADALEVPLKQIVYYAQTCLRPNCSQIALLPSLTEEGIPMVARNYEFSHEAEDFTLMKTSVTGKYTHLGTSVFRFGRDDGFNECGLAVTMSSCGFPVGANEYMRRPKLKGLQFWAVTRSVLENCKDVEEALEFVKDMPIAFNINLMLTDKTGHAALVETLDGHMEIKKISEEGPEHYLCATNHPVIPEMIPYEPRAMRHSLVRYEYIRRTIGRTGKVNGEKLKEMLLSMYPDGLCCHFFHDFFGTTKSMLIKPSCGTIELCWGGDISNGWKIYDITKPLEYEVREIEIQDVPFRPELGEFIPI